MTKYHPLIRFNIQHDKQPDYTAEKNRIAQLKKELEGIKKKIKVLNTEKKTIESEIRKISTFVKPKKTKS